MIIFDGDQLKLGSIQKNGKVKSEKPNSDISLLNHYTDEVLINEKTTLENLVWSFLNDKNSEELSESLNYLTGGKNFFSLLRNKLKDGSKGRFVKIDWLEFVSTPVILNGSTEEYFVKKYEENWTLTAWKERANKKPNSLNISSLSFNSLLKVPVKQKYETNVYNREWEEIGKFRSLPNVSDVLETLCQEFYLFRKKSNKNGLKFSYQNRDFVSLNDLKQ